MSKEQVKVEQVVVGGPDDVVARDDENFSRALSIEERAAQVKQRAVDIFDNGQTQPVRAYAVSRGKPHVYIGHTRVAAVALIRAGFKVPTGETEVVPDPNGEEGATVERPVFREIKDESFPLRYVVDEITPEEAAVKGIADNFQNNKPNDLDLARAAKALQDQFNYTDAKVTAILGVSDPFKIGRVKKLLSAPAVIQKAIQEDKLATSAALEALKHTGPARKAAVSAITEAVEKGKGITALQVGKAAASAPATHAELVDAEGTKPSKPPRRALQGSEIREELTKLESELKEELTDGKNAGRIPQEYHDTVSALLRWVNGDIKAPAMVDALEMAFGTKRGRELIAKKAEKKATAEARKAAAKAKTVEGAEQVTKEEAVAG